ncbi:MAG: hypothetical protein CTY25_14655 [Methylobacterium sp.]|nr:MAG: hypothetical protein CTY25_14655 [Methylobacterium sp.]
MPALPDRPDRIPLQHGATGPHRFAELRRKVAGLSERMLSQTLQDLKADGFVLRTAHAVVPQHVDYELTDLGKEAAKHVVALATWIEAALPEILPRKAAAGRAGSYLPHAAAQAAKPDR